MFKEYASDIAEIIYGDVPLEEFFQEWPLEEQVEVLGYNPLEGAEYEEKSPDTEETVTISPEIMDLHEEVMDLLKRLAVDYADLKPDGKLRALLESLGAEDGGKKTPE